MTVVDRTPAAEVEVDDALVRALLAEQQPSLASLPLELAASGWDNVTYRLGDDLAVRLPRREVAAQLIRHEHDHLPHLAPALPLPVPVPTHRGEPSGRYPWPWSVLPWLAGEPADLRQPDDGEAAVLGGFLRALHGPAPASAPANPFRGVPLAARDLGFGARVARLGERGADTAPLTAAWRAARHAPVATQRCWLHGDLHPRNVLVADGRLAAVIDWGDLTAGDPATDLAAAWSLWDVAAHPALRDAYGDHDPGLWARAAGWAALFASIFLEVGADDPRFLTIGRRTAARLRADQTGRGTR